MQVKPSSQRATRSPIPTYALHHSMPLHCISYLHLLCDCSLDSIFVMWWYLLWWDMLVDTFDSIWVPFRLWSWDERWVRLCLPCLEYCSDFYILYCILWIAGFSWVQIVVWGMDGVKGVFVFCILYLCLVSSCEYPLILVLTLAFTQPCRLIARFLYTIGDSHLGLSFWILEG